MNGKLWRISGFNVGPHWDAAIVRAATADEAREALAARLEDEDSRPDTVWSETEPAGDWSVSEIADATQVVFLLGAGCR